MALFVLALIVSTQCINAVWQAVEGRFKDFLDADENEAEDYLVNGVKWYQLKINLHGSDFYIPLSIASEMKSKSIFQWILALPIMDIRTDKNLK